MNLKDRIQADRARLGLTGQAPDVPMLPPATPPKLTVVTQQVDGPPTDAEIKDLQADANADRKNATAAAIRSVQNSLTFFQDAHASLRLQVTRASGRIDVPHADSEDAEDFIRAKIQAVVGDGKTVAQSAVDQVVQAGRARARAEQVRKHVHMRLAGDAGDIVIDTANDAGEVIRVNASGYRVEPQGEILFHRGSGTGQIPHPVQTTPAQAYEILAKFAASHGVRNNDIAVYVIVLIEHLRPKTPCPILELIGPAGARKSTMARASVSIFDPSQSGEVLTTNLTEPDVMAASGNRFALHLDNASSLSPKEQDLACRISTGGEISARQFYSQRELEAAHVQRPLVITAITAVLTRSDARSRTITVALNPPTRSYKSEADIREAFKSDHPSLIGAACSLLSVGLAGLAAVKTQRHYTHRLVDFEQIGESVHQALGQKPGWFGDILATRRKADAAAIAEGDPILAALLKSLATWQADPKLLCAVKPTGRQIARGACVWKEAGRCFTVATTATWLRSVSANMPFGLNEQPPASERALKHAITHRMGTIEALGWRVQSSTANNQGAMVLSKVDT